MSHYLEFADWIPVPLPRVFAFFSNPENLPRLMAPETQTRLDQLKLVAPPPSANTDEQTMQHAAGIGSVLTTSFRPIPFLPIRKVWIARIVEFEWNHHFADVQETGPFKSWHHRHEFEAEKRNGAEGTIVRDKIDYQVGFGPLGQIGNKFLIARQMTQAFVQRQIVLPKLLM